MLSELSGEGWKVASPPNRRDDGNVVARYNGEQIKAGASAPETITDTEKEVHLRYRTGQYDLEVKIDFEIGRGQLKVEEADGYNHDNS